MESVQVEIFGQKYTIKGKDDGAYIRQLARFLDEKMKEVQKATGTVDPLRVAILTALTISDELHRIGEQQNTMAQITQNGIRLLLDLTRKPENGDEQP